MASGLGLTQEREADGAVRLTVCIPTYNFGRFLGEALDSILVQWVPGVEIVVLDSASTDDTPAVVQERQNSRVPLRYVRAAEKLGIDRDMARVVELARGDYVWLFSADDVAKPNALQRLLSEMDSGHDIYVCMHSNETVRMETVHAAHPVLTISHSAAFELSDPTQQLKYFSLVASTEGFFSYMSGLLVRREKWNAVALNENFVGTCWAHVARFFELMPNGLTVCFVAAVLVRRRGDNDSFASHGLVRRYALSIQGYLELARHFWGDKTPQAFHIRRVLRAEFPMRIFWAAKHHCERNPLTESVSLLNDLMIRIYSDRTASCVMKRFAYRLLPGYLYGPARATFLRVRRIWAAT